MENRKTSVIDVDAINKYIDLNRYPIHDLDCGAGQALIARARQMMQSETLCLLEGFLREGAVSAISSEITQLEPEAHKLDYLCTPYGWMNNAGFPPDHPPIIG